MASPTSAAPSTNSSKKTKQVVVLFVSLVALGLAAIDPIGLAAMPVLLVQRRPFARSFAFLGGSFASLMVMGLLFARGFGLIVLHFEKAHAWLVPSIEVLAGAVLLGIAATVFWQLKTGRVSVEPPAKLRNRLNLSELHLFAFGAALVAVQSLLDVVFVIAMIRIGQIHLSVIALTAAVMTYAVTALILQFSVLAAFKLTPEKQKHQILAKVHNLLAHYANQAVIGVSLILGSGLLINGMLTAAGAPHL